MTNSEPHLLLTKRYKTKYVFLKYLYCLFLILLATRPIPILQELSNVVTEIDLAILIVVIASYSLLLLFENHKLNHALLIVLSFYLFHSVLIYAKFGTIHPRFFFIYFSSTILAYIGLNLLKDQFFPYIENVLFVLCVITIPFYLWGIIHIESLRTVLISLGSYISPSKGIYTIFFVLRPDYNTALLRNSGFCWEPGMFATILNTAILINLIINSFAINKRIIIYTLLLLSTQSTTGYLGFFLIILFYLINSQRSYYLAIVVILLLLPFLYNLPFIGDKINESMKEDPTELVTIAAQSDELIQPQRFASFQIAFTDFIKNPILGYGGHDEDSWIYEKYGRSTKLGIVSGVGDFMAVFGIFGILTLIYISYKSCRKLSKEYSLKGAFYIFLVLFSFFVSYRIFNMAIYHCFLFYFLYSARKLYKINLKSELI